jgi:serine phosphatase RsbU (regulator of sigma subunit)/tetratricopeptide (TPR) repeat protein
MFWGQSVWAQSPEKELRKKLREANLPDTVSIKLMLDLGNVLSQTDSVMAGVGYMEKALQLAEKTNVPRWIAGSHLTIGQLHARVSNHAEALQSYQKALPIYEQLKMNPQITFTLQLIGKIHEIQQNYDRALSYYQKALEYAEKYKLNKQKSFAYNNIGNIYLYKKEFSQSIAWQLKAITLRKATDSSSIQYSYNDIAQVYLEIGKQDSALYYLEKSHEIARKNGDLQLQAWGAVGLAMSLDSANRHKEAVEVVENGLKIAQKLRIKDAIVNTTQYLAIAYTGDNRLKEAIAMYELNGIYRDSLATEQRAKEIAKLETNHEIKRHAQENQLIKAEKEQQRYWLIAAMVGVVLLLGVAVMLVRLNNFRRKTNVVLEAKNQEIQEANHELHEKNEEINQQKEEILIIAENLEDMNKELNQKNEDITASIAYASRIQQAILPTLDYMKQGFGDAFVLYQPRDVVSGDFYFFAQFEGNHILAVADCTGHGVPGALMSMIGNELLHEIINERHTVLPAQILADLHKGIRKALKQHETDNRDGMDIAIVNYQPEAQTLQYAGAKNPLVYIENGEVKYLKANSWGIGGEQREMERTFTNHSLPTTHISWAYMFSDGFQDQFGGSQNKKFGITRLREQVGKIHTAPSNEQHEMLLSTFQHWRTEGGEKQIDDVLVVGIKLS